MSQNPLNDMTVPEGNLDAVLHSIIKKYMNKRQQGLCMAEIREALGIERSSEDHLSHSHLAKNTLENQ